MSSRILLNVNKAPNPKAKKSKKQTQQARRELRKHVTKEEVWRNDQQISKR